MGDFNFASLILALILVLIVALALRSVIRQRKKEDALSRLLVGKTVLVIAHRMRTVEAADKIIVLSEGSVAEEGRPEDLLAQDSIFRSMTQLQASSADWSI